MASYLIYAHGSRAAGTSSGTFVVPPGMTIYFFEKDGEYLYNLAARLIMDALLVNAPDEAAVQAMAKESKTAWDTIPSYKASGDPGKPDMGMYMVGQTLAAGAITPIPYGAVKTIGSLVGSSAANTAIGTSIYWLCCRAAPLNASVSAVKAQDTVTVGAVTRNLNAVKQAAALGKTPSQVKASGIWR